jgi:hypothetical protein
MQHLSAMKSSSTSLLVMVLVTAIIGPILTEVFSKRLQAPEPVAGPGPLVGAPSPVRKATA